MQCKDNVDFSVAGEQSCVILLSCHTKCAAVAAFALQPAVQM